MTDISEDEVVQIVTGFLLNAPPGEFMEVVTGKKKRVLIFFFSSFYFYFLFSIFFTSKPNINNLFFNLKNHLNQWLILKMVFSNNNNNNNNLNNEYE
jgi:hypothetical protein